MLKDWLALLTVILIILGLIFGPVWLQWLIGGTITAFVMLLIVIHIFDRPNVSGHTR